MTCVRTSLHSSDAVKCANSCALRTCNPETVVAVWVAFQSSPWVDGIPQKTEKLKELVERISIPLVVCNISEAAEGRSSFRMERSQHHSILPGYTSRINSHWRRLLYMYTAHRSYRLDSSCTRVCNVITMYWTTAMYLSICSASL